MNLSLEAAWLAEVHRETYVAILKSWIPHGEKETFAQLAGISREYLSYLCALDSPAAGKFPTRRLPSLQLARQMAAILPAPAEIRASLVENMDLAHMNAAKAHYIIRNHISSQRVSELLVGMQDLHRRATFGTELADVLQAYRALRDVSVDVLEKLSPKMHLASFVQVCLYLHDSQCILDRADDALRYAKLARLVMENSDNFDSGSNKEQLHNLEINAIRGEAVAYHNLGLDREVPRLCEHARSSLAYRNNGEYWMPFVERDLLNSLMLIPRYSKRDAKRIAHRIQDICERRGDEFMLLLGREALLRLLLQHEQYNQAAQLYRKELERISSIPYVGSLHRALLLRGGALLSWKIGDKVTWKQQIVETLKLMYQSGLKHQIRQVRELYGPALRLVSEELRDLTVMLPE